MLLGGKGDHGLISHLGILGSSRFIVNEEHVLNSFIFLCPSVYTIFPRR